MLTISPKPSVVVPPIGTIFVSIFGYEAALANFYQVVAHKGKSSVEVREIGQVRTGNYMDGTAAGVKDDFVGEPRTKRVKAGYNGAVMFKNSSYSNAYVWNGEPVSTYNHH